VVEAAGFLPQLGKGGHLMDLQVTEGTDFEQQRHAFWMSGTSRILEGARVVRGFNARWMGDKRLSAALG
jgi:hypothetical protein